MLFDSKDGEISPIMESQIGYTFFLTVKKTSVEEVRELWKKSVSSKLLSQKSRTVWEKHQEDLLKKHKVEIYKKTLESYLKALEEKKSVADLKGSPLLKIDNTTYFFSDIVDPSGSGIVHGDGAIESLIEKRIRQHALSREFEKYKQGYPEIKIREKYIKENILARAFMDYRSRDIRITKEDIRAYYEENRKKFVRPMMYDISAIETKSSDRLKKIYGQLAGGEDFGKVAEKWSDGIEKYPKGHVGLIPEGRISKEFSVVRTLKPGQYTEPPVKLPLSEAGQNIYVVLKLNRVEKERLVPFSEVDKAEIQKAVMARQREEIAKRVMREIAERNKVSITPYYYEFVRSMQKQ